MSLCSIMSVIIAVISAFPVTGHKIKPYHTLHSCVTAREFM